MAIDYTKLIEKLDPEKDGQDVTTLRTGIVDEVNVDGTLDIILSGIVVPNVPRLGSVGAVVGDAVQVQTYRGSMLVIGNIASVTAPHLPSSNSMRTAGPGANDDTASTSFVNMAGTSTLSFTKRYAASKVTVFMHAAMFGIGAVADIEIGVQIDGVDYAINSLSIPNTVFTSNNGSRVITGVTSGVKTIQARWRRASGAGNARRNAGGTLNMSAIETG
jgi:hypothetical protein